MAQTAADRDGINGLMEALRRRQERVRFVQVSHEESAATTLSVLIPNRTSSWTTCEISDGRDESRPACYRNGDGPLTCGGPAAATPPTIAPKSTCESSVTIGVMRP